MKIIEETTALVEAAVDELAATLERRDSSGTRLNDLLRSLEAVAFQTNLMALNAAVEAAQPGDSHVGFAAMAGGLRDLAHQSACAAKEAAQLIEEALLDSTLGADEALQVADTMKRNAEVGEMVTTLVDRINAANHGTTADLPSAPAPVTQTMRAAARQIHLIGGIGQPD